MDWSVLSPLLCLANSYMFGVVMTANGFKVMATELRLMWTLSWTPREIWPSLQGAHHNVSFGTK